MEDNYEVVGIIERYGESIFINADGTSMNVDTNAIKNILEAEGYTGKQYTQMFNDIALYTTTSISKVYENQRNK
jgi:hypothetical protein